VTAPSYTELRRLERRAACLNCGMSDDACTRSVLNRSKACCGTCGYTDTHPRPDGSHDGEPCTCCRGSGIESA
jgi:hypothetical protein